MSDVGDLILVHVDGKPSFFVRIDEIKPDIKPGWYQTTLLLLAIPLRKVTWILRKPQIDGEPFTMQGIPIRMEKIDLPYMEAEFIQTEKKETKKRKRRKESQDNIIVFTPKKKE